MIVEDQPEGRVMERMRQGESTSELRKDSLPQGAFYEEAVATLRRWKSGDMSDEFHTAIRSSACGSHRQSGLSHLVNVKVNSGDGW